MKINKIIVQFFKCKIPERVVFTGEISICKRFSKVSHRCEIFTFFFLLGIYIMTYNTRFVFKTKK